MTEELQAQGEELQAQGEELQAQAEELRVQTDDLAERVDLADSLNGINRLVHSTLDFDQILQRALDEGVRALAVDAGAIEMREDPCWYVRYQCGFTADDVGTCLTTDEAPNATRALKSMEPFSIADMRGMVDADVGFVRAHSLRAVLAVPLLARDTVIGCLLFYGKKPRAFAEAETDFGRKLGATVSLALENARLAQAELEARKDEATRAARLSVLKEIADSASSSLDPHVAATSVVNSVHSLLAARQVQIRLVNDDRTALESAASVDPEGMLARLGSLPVDADTETARCFRSKGRRTGEDVASAQVSDASRRNVKEAGIRSYVLIPLIANGEAIGTFYVAWAEPRHFETEELAFLEAVAAQSATGLENARLYEAERDAQRRAKLELETTGLLLEAANTATSWSDIDRLLESLADLVVRSTAHTRVVVELWDEEHGEIEIAVSKGSTAVPKQRFRFDEISDAAREVITTGKTFVIDYDETTMPRPLKHYLDEHAFRLLLAVPMLYREQLIGLIMVDQPGERLPFSPREVQLVEAIAGQAGTSIANARLLERDAHAARLAAALNDINGMIHSTFKVDEIMQRVVAHAVDAVGADSAMVALRHGDDWVAEYGHPEVPGVIHQSVQTDEAPFILTAVDERRPVAIDDCETDPALHP